LWLYRKFITRGVVWFSEIGQVSGEAKYLVSDSMMTFQSNDALVT